MTQASTVPRPVDAGPLQVFTRTIKRIRVPAKLRNLELALLIFAILIVEFAVVLVQLGALGRLFSHMLILTGALGLLAIAMHIVLRFVAPEADPFILPVIFLLNGIGIAMIYRIDLAKKLTGWDSAGVRQIVWTAMAMIIAGAVLVLIRNHRVLQRYRYVAMFIGIVLLLLPMLPGIGRTVNGARLWIGIGSFTFQPGELAKIALAIFFAAYLVEKRELLAIASWPRFRPVLPDPKHLGPVIVAWGLSIMVMTAEKDLGSSLLFFALFMVMLWVATERARYLAVGAVLFSAASYFAWKTFAHVQQRVDGWLNPWAHATGPGGYQIIQGWYAMAWGGIAGTGLGLGTPTRIPEVKNDFIFAGIAEELGLLGATALLVTFVLMIGAGLRIAVRAESAFDKLLATGLTALLGIQSFIIIAGVTRLLPLTGVTLPFVSYGGSSLLANYVLIALLMRISDQTNRREELREREAVAA